VPQKLQRAARLASLLLAALALAAQWVPNRYLVELTEPPAADVALEQEPGVFPQLLRSDFRTYAIRARRQQQALRAELRRRGIQVLDSVEIVANALIVSASQADIAALETLSGVRRVWPARRIRRSLARALPLHHVYAAWTALGDASRAGLGIKIAIIDTGIDISHPAFQDPALPMPAGFPRANTTSELAWTNNKVIVARNYRVLLEGRPGTVPDVDGHGTGVAMAAAGFFVSSEEGTLSGVAPKAYLGSYSVFPSNGDTSEDVVLKALDDAARDGMDVINLSLGSVFAPRPTDSLLAAAVDRLERLGTLVVVAAGNEGDGPFTISDLGVAPKAISVGASWTDRVFAASVRLSDGSQYPAIPGTGPRPSSPIVAPLRDVSSIDGTGLACGQLPPGSLQNAIAFILRGICYFRDKLNSAQAAGAVGGLVYTDAGRPDAIIMDVGDATLPAMMVSHADGLKIKQSIQQQPGLVATLDFSTHSVPVDPNRLAAFSSRGPSTDLGIKPDLLATGVSVRTAALRGTFSLVDGTSIAAPLAAGAAAVVKAARPNLPAFCYRSLLVNTATPLRLSSGAPVPVMEAGAGLLNLEAALRASLAVWPVSLSFQTPSRAVRRSLLVFNLSSEAVQVTVTLEPYRGPAPVIEPAAFTLPARSARSLWVTVDPTGLPAGTYEGMIWFHPSLPGGEVHVPYWWAIPSSEPARLRIVWQQQEGRAGTLQRAAIAVRTTSAEGLPLLIPPEVSVVSGGGSVVSVFSSDDISPGLYEVSVRLGPVPGNNIFRVRVGNLERDVTIRGY